jgi:hypothetical protein
MKFFVKIAAIAAATLTTAISHASPATMTVTGIVTFSQDSNGMAFGAGAGDNTLQGRSIVQVFTYDTETVLRNQSEDPNIAQLVPEFSSAGNWGSWISVTTTIDGVILGEPVETLGEGLYSNIDSITIADEYRPGHEWRDLFNISYGAMNLSPEMSSSLYTHSQTSLSIDMFGNFVSGVELDQTFSLNVAERYFFGGGMVTRGQTRATPGGSLDVYSGYLHYVAHTVNLSTVTAVPEGPSALMLALGGIFLFSRRMAGAGKLAARAA